MAGTLLLLVAPHEEHSLGRLSGLDVEQLRQIIDGLRRRRGNLFHGQRFTGHRIAATELGHLRIGRVATFGATHDRILTHTGEIHVLVGHLAAHDPGVGGNGHRRDPAAVEDVEVGLVVGPVLHLETFLGGIQ